MGAEPTIATPPQEPPAHTAGLQGADPTLSADPPATPADPAAQADPPATPAEPAAEALPPAEPADPTARATPPAEPADPTAGATPPAEPADLAGTAEFSAVPADDPAVPADLPAVPADLGPRERRDAARQRDRAGARPHLVRKARGRGRTSARAGALLALALAVFGVWFLLSLFQPFAGAGSGAVIVEIPKGASSGKIGSILARDGVVSSGFFFDVRALLEGKRGALHPGRFQLKRNMSYAAAIEALSKPPPAAIVVKVVIPEGYTRLQIADLAREEDLSGGYLAASQRSSLLRPTHYGAPQGTPNLEGFLFPATYEMDAGVPVSKLVAQQLLAFRQRFSSGEIRRAHELHVTPYQLLTVASMVEREAQAAHDRPLIAAVIYNRLRSGTPLGIDATIYYAVELQKGIATYTHELSEAQLRIDSPYNTRIHKGLPPTPISNPGMASIEAAAHPAHVSYLYYVAAADGCGEHAFSTTYARFQANVAAYDAAVKKNGGHLPTCKKK
jgi:UPF0755 protein